MRAFQIIFNPTSAAELSRMPKELQLEILGQFRGLPQEILKSDLEGLGSWSAVAEPSIGFGWASTAFILNVTSLE